MLEQGVRVLVCVVEARDTIPRLPIEPVRALRDDHKPAPNFSFKLLRQRLADDNTSIVGARERLTVVVDAR